MKKFLITLALVLGVSSAYAESYTDNLNLWKPDPDDYTARVPALNGNWDIVESVFTGTAVGKTQSSIVSSGDHTDVSLKVRTTNTANQPTGYVLRGADIEARVTGGEATNVQGATITAQTHATAGSQADSIYGLKVESKSNGWVTTEIYGEDIRMFRQAVTAPTGDEIALRIRNANLAGTGIDSAIQVKSDASGETDDFVAGVDMSGADIDQAQLVFSNGAKLFVGTANGENAVYAEVGAYDATGSIYISSVGKIYVQVANNGANADWETVTSASAQ